MKVVSIAASAEAVLDEVERAIVGKRAALEMVLMGILAGGHILLEDYPGLAKTLIARSFSQVLGLRFSRIQFTPDLMPSDVTGSSLLDQRSTEFVFRPGPIFANLVLADEVNRAPAKTQAALLEAMQEFQVTVDGVTHQLEQPFSVIATQNPIEFEGTYALPEAQLDRFLMRLQVGYPQRQEEWEMLSRRATRKQDEVVLQQKLGSDELLELRERIETVHVSEAIGLYMVDLVTATRKAPAVQVGASPRGSLAVMKLARCHAALRGRDYVVPEDVKAVAVPALSHRLTLRPEVWIERVTGGEVVQGCLRTVPTPPAEA